MKRGLWFCLAAWLTLVMGASSIAQERIYIKPGAKEANLQRTWHRYVRYLRAHTTGFAAYLYYEEWPMCRPVTDPELQQTLLSKCAVVLEEEGFGTREKAVTLLFKYLGYYYASVDSGFEDLHLGGRAFQDEDCCFHLYAFDRDLNHVASFHQGGFIQGRFLNDIPQIHFDAVDCGPGQSNSPPGLSGSSSFEYPPPCRAMGIQGDVKVRGAIQADGSVTDVKIAKSDNCLFNASVIAGISHLHFEPGRCGESPVSTPFTATVTFRINRP